MSSQLVKMSKEMFEKRKSDPTLRERMRAAAKGQSPRFLLISSMDHSQQDLQLLSLEQGDAFHATRVPRKPLMSASQSPFLFGGPAAYSSHFADRTGVIVTFEAAESDGVIQASLKAVSSHPDLKGVPLVALRADYEAGTARLVPHGLGRSYEVENLLMSRVRRPLPNDETTLVVICSDSRVEPPPTPRGVPMAIQCLGGYIPRFSGDADETSVLNEFFATWLSMPLKERHLIIVAHGDFEGEGQSCGAGMASIHPNEVHSAILKHVIGRIDEDARRFENRPPSTPEERVQSIARATQANLMTYPAIQSVLGSRASLESLIETVLMDTVTNRMQELQTS
ncbi:MAG: hypothetical protein HXY34_11535 [Candidatus Thorarchaeota archaeon]|nr:hypothetical protein [Candidatus Thorarchaeota archaeon]